jgi:hypothetical protein
MMLPAAIGSGAVGMLDRATERGGHEASIASRFARGCVQRDRAASVSGAPLSTWAATLKVQIIGTNSYTCKTFTGSSMVTIRDYGPLQ